MILNYEFQYPTTLCIEFDIPLGASGYKFKNKKEIKDFYMNAFMGCNYSYMLLCKCIEYENNIHNINSSKFKPEMIYLIKKDLKKLLFKRK
jgi:hypothetical protein